LALFAGKNNTSSADEYNSTQLMRSSANYMSTQMTGPCCHLSCFNFSEMFRDSSLFLLHYSLLFKAHFIGLSSSERSVERSDA